MTKTQLFTLSALALERSAQSPTATCPSSLQGCLLFAALQGVEAAIRGNKTSAMIATAEHFPPAVWQAPGGYMLSTFAGGSGGSGSSTPAGHMSQLKTPSSPQSPVLCSDSPSWGVA